MKYCIVDSCEWTYPDVHDYETAATSVRQRALQGSFATFQIHVWETDAPLAVACAGFAAELYEQIPIPVESNPNFEKPVIPEAHLKVAPFLVNDCLRPLTGQLSPRHGSIGIYVAIPAGELGTFSGSVVLACGEETASIPVTVEVCAPAPAETLKVVMGYSPYHAARWHRVLGDPAATDALDTQYLRMLRRQHQNRIYFDPPHIHRDAEGKYSFDFTDFNARVKKALALGFTGFHIGGVGFRRAWDAPDIVIRGMDALSYEAYVYLYQYLTALRENLRENGWLHSDLFCIGIADEPNDINALTYRAVSGMVRRLMPELKIYEACSGAPIYGAVDIWVPRSDEYEAHREMFDAYKEMGDEVWQYVCLFPRDNGYINRFMDIPLLATRYIYWGNYKYDLAGYLHWTVHTYENDIDPFTASCPRHVNAGSASILPSGDDKLIYPGTDGPWMSMRLEAHRESAEEYEMLKAIAAKDKAAADALCARGLRSFTDVTYDGRAFRALREDIIAAYAEM